MNRKIWNLLKSVLFVFLVVFIIIKWFFIPVTVSGNSMMPTLLDGERGISFIWGKADLNRFDIVVLETERGLIVKRIIAFGGEEISVVDDNLYINQQRIEQPFLNQDYINQFSRVFTEDFGPIVVPENHIFVMGDNRPASLDSRSQQFGPFPLSAVVSKGIFIFYPFHEIKLLGY